MAAKGAVFHPLDIIDEVTELVLDGLSLRLPAHSWRVSLMRFSTPSRLTRCVDSARKPAKEIETEYLVSSRPAEQMNAQQMLQADRRYWGIETGLHLRLDVIAGEDRSRVRKPNAVMNLAVIRRAVVSVAGHWIRTARVRARPA